MGLEFDLFELEALRPIRTSLSGSRVTSPGDSGKDTAGETGTDSPISCGATGTGGREEREDGASGTGCLTQDVVDVDNGCITATTSGAAAQQDGGEDGRASCVTPTSALSALRPATVCPPAPRKRKPRPAKRKGCGLRRPPQRFFFPVPHDLTAVFVASRPAKKILTSWGDLQFCTA